jgi:hypothetical protein
MVSNGLYQGSHVYLSLAVALKLRVESLPLGNLVGGAGGDRWRNIAISLIDPLAGGFECNRLVTTAIIGIHRRGSLLMRRVAMKKQCNPPLFFKGGTDQTTIIERLSQDHHLASFSTLWQLHHRVGNKLVEQDR